MDHLSIPLHRRISEIMKERGRLSQEFVATRIGIHRDTFRSVLRGRRPIYGTELRKLAEVLKVSVERLNQTDTLKEIEFLDECLNDLTHLEKALPVAEKLLSLAVGITERYDALDYLGRVYFELKKYNEAHAYLVEAYELALLIQQNYGETDRLHRVAKNLMILCTVRKDFANAQEKIDQLKSHFIDDPIALGSMYYSLAMIAFNSGNLQETKTCLYESMFYFIQAGDPKQIGNAEHCVGYIEYLLGNLSVSRDMFEKAINTLSPYLEYKLVSIKDYLKVLLKQGEQATVKRLLHEAQNELDRVNNHVLLFDFQLLRMFAYNNPSEGESLMLNEASNQRQKQIACRFLIDYYKTNGDFRLSLHYYELERLLVEEGVPLVSKHIFDIVGDVEVLP